uniref:Uncharacterized protein n=1 Tax=Davidia involucrata TaxID=16924 RepID=A0A5B7BEM9_DAVIN
MPSSPFNLLFMERRKPKGSIGESAIVKAAAWAWYQHGSGSEGRPILEHDVTRTRRAHEPSRYKLEAIKTAQEAMEGSYSSTSPILGPSHSDISLLDAYEIERISRQLDYYIESSDAEYYGRLFDGDHRGTHRRIVSMLPESEASGGMKNKKMSKKVPKGFWHRRGVVVCGSRNDVVETRGLEGGRPPEKRAAVVKVANCRPRATHA